MKTEIVKKQDYFIHSLNVKNSDKHSKMSSNINHCFLFMFSDNESERTLQNSLYARSNDNGICIEESQYAPLR